MAYREIRLARGGSEATVDARTYHQRCSRDLHVSTETWSKVRDLIEKSETRESKICGLCRYFFTNFEKILSQPQSCNFFEFLAFFLPALFASYLQIQQRKTRWFTKVLLSHIVAVIKDSCESSCDWDETSNLRDWDSKDEQSRDRNEVSMSSMQWWGQYSL